MNRRQLLKQATFSAGYMAVAPNVLSLLHSCSSPSTTWVSVVIPMRYQKLIDILIDLILPQTTTLGAADLNLVQFIDKMIAYTEDTRGQKNFVLGAAAFQNMVEKTFNRKKDTENTKFEIETVLETLCKLSANKQARVFKQLKQPIYEIPEKDKNMYLVYFFITKLRTNGLLGYYTSEDVMGNIQGFNPNLGYYEACIDKS